MENILIVDDEKFIRLGLRAMIESSGIKFKEIVECRNGIQALEVTKEMQFDLIFTDIKMPQLNGIEFISKLKSLNYETEIIILSGYEEFNYAVEAFKNGAREYILKPIERTVVADILIKIEADQIEKLKSKVQYDEEKLKTKQMKKDYEEALSALKFTALGIEDKIENDIIIRQGLNLNPQMEEAIRYIKENYQSSLNMATVSNHVSLCYSFFSGTFKSYTGISFVNYLKSIRINNAKNLLTFTDKKIAQISKEVGFLEEKQFMKAFKQLTQLSPTEYRKFSKIIQNNPSYNKKCEVDKNE